MGFFHPLAYNPFAICFVPSKVKDTLFSYGIPESQSSYSFPTLVEIKFYIPKDLGYYYAHAAGVSTLLEPQLYNSPFGAPNVAYPLVFKGILPPLCSEDINICPHFMLPKVLHAYITSQPWLVFLAKLNHLINAYVSTYTHLRC